MLDFERRPSLAQVVKNFGAHADAEMLDLQAFLPERSTDFKTDHLAEPLNAHGKEDRERASIFGIEKVKGISKYFVAVMNRPKT